MCTHSNHQTQMHFQLQIESRKGWTFNQTKIANKPSEKKKKKILKKRWGGIHNPLWLFFWIFQPPTSLVATKSNMEATKYVDLVATKSFYLVDIKLPLNTSLYLVASGLTFLVATIYNDPVATRWNLCFRIKLKEKILCTCIHNLKEL